MKNFGSPTPKRSLLWANATKVSNFRTDRLQRRGEVANQLVIKYKNKKGESKFQGNAAMKRSGTFSCILKKHITSASFAYTFEDIMRCHHCMEQLSSVNLRTYPLGFALRYISCWEDLKDPTSKGKLRPALEAGFCFSLFYRNPPAPAQSPIYTWLQP